MLRQALLAAAAGLVWTGAATAAPPDPVPKLKDRPPYAQARKELLRQGFEPVRFNRDMDQCATDTSGERDRCRLYPEVTDCPSDRPLCIFTLRRRSDGRFLQILTHVDADAPPRVLSVDWANRYIAQDIREETAPRAR